jgi:hypothetical protein
MKADGAAYVQLHVATDVAQAIAGNKQRPLTAQVYAIFGILSVPIFHK